MVVQTTGDQRYQGQGWSWTIDTHNKVGNLTLADGSVPTSQHHRPEAGLQNGTNTIVYPVGISTSKIPEHSFDKQKGARKGAFLFCTAPCMCSQCSRRPP